MPRPGLLRLRSRNGSAGFALVAVLAASCPTAAVAAGPTPPRLTGTAAPLPPVADEQKASPPATSTPPPVEAEPPGGTAEAPQAAPLPAPPPLPAQSPGPATMVPPPGSVPPSAGAGATQARDDSLQDLMPLVEDEPPRSRLNTTAWVGVGVTTLLLGVAGFYGASASSKAGDANRLLSFGDSKTGVPQEYAARAEQFEEDVRLGRRYDRLAKGFALGACVTALASAVLFILDDSPGNREPAIQARGPVHTPPTSRRAAARSLSVRATVAATPGPNLNLSWSF